MTEYYRLSHSAQQIDATIANALTKTEQSLTAEEKAQVKANLGLDFIEPGTGVTKNYIESLLKEELGYSVGLRYDLALDGAYYNVADIGTSTATEIIIPSEYHGLPVKNIYTSSLTSSNITKIKFPSSIQEISASAFNGSTNIVSFDFTDFTDIPTIANNAFAGISENYKIIVPKNLLESWKAANTWKQYADHICGNEINFRIGSNEYTAELGMTWRQWCASDYNTNNFESATHKVYNSNHSLYVSQTVAYDIIIEGKQYNYSAAGPLVPIEPEW